MKHIFLGLIMSALPPLAASVLGADVDARCESGEPCIVMISDGDGDAANHVVRVVVNGSSSPNYAFVSVDGDTDGIADGRSEGEHKVIRVERIAVAGDETGGWLGVSIGSVSDALASQLGIDGRGMVIQNVVEDSPADQAGLLEHDVVLSINGQDLGSDFLAAVKAIKQHEPGEVVSLMVLRNGVNMPVTVTLGSRAEMGASGFRWKFDVDRNAVIEDQIRTRGHFMFKDGDGTWITRDLGDLDDLDNLPANIRAFVPKSGTQTVTIKALGGNSTVQLNVNRDGESININRNDGGPIVVERRDAQGVESTATYETPEEFEAADPDAFDIYANTGNGNTFALTIDGLDDLHGVFDMDHAFSWTGDQADWDEHIAAWEAALGESLGATREAYEESMAQANRMLEELKANAWVGGDGAHLATPTGDGKMQAFMFNPFASKGKPKHTFESRADGTIEVRVRKGDSELVQLYADEQDLQRRAPDLYEKYDDLMSLDAE